MCELQTLLLGRILENTNSKKKKKKKRHWFVGRETNTESGWIKMTAELKRLVFRLFKSTFKSHLTAAVPAWASKKQFYCDRFDGRLNTKEWSFLTNLSQLQYWTGRCLKHSCFVMCGDNAVLWNVTLPTLQCSKQCGCIASQNSHHSYCLLWDGAWKKCTVLRRFSDIVTWSKRC